MQIYNLLFSHVLLVPEMLNHNTVTNIKTLSEIVFQDVILDIFFFYSYPSQEFNFIGTVDYSLFTNILIEQTIK